MALSEYVAIVRKRWLLIALLIAIGCSAAVFGGNSLSKPTYTASSRLIVNNAPAGANGQPVNQADLQVNIMLINTYKELITTPPVLQEVIKRYPDLRLTEGELGQSLKVTTKAGSQIMTVSWEDPSYERAAKIVNAVAGVFTQTASSWVRADNVGVLSEADPAAKPSPAKIGNVLLLLIGLICSGFVAILLAFLLEALDPRMRRAADVERTLGYPVLVAVEDIRKGSLKTIASEGVSKKRVGEDHRVHVNG